PLPRNRAHPGADGAAAARPLTPASPPVTPSRGRREGTAAVAGRPPRPPAAGCGVGLTAAVKRPPPAGRFPLALLEAERFPCCQWLLEREKHAEGRMGQDGGASATW